MINAILVDDHALFRMGVRMLLEKRCPDVKIVGEAATGAAFFRLLQETPPDLILLDIILPDISGIEIAQCLKKEHPHIKILALAAENSQTTIQRMLDIGIEGFISKSMTDENMLIQAIYAINDGFEFFGKDISEIMYRIYIAKQKNTAKNSTLLTQQEQQIIELCQKRMFAKEIAAHLNIAPRTVEKHKEKIFKKLGINSTYDMVQYALKHGII